MIYLKIALRVLIANKLFAILNIAGIAAGISCSIFVLLWADDESVYEGAGSKAAYISRLIEYEAFNIHNFILLQNVSESIADKMIKKMPEASGYSLFYTSRPLIVSANNLKSIEDKIIFADSNFLHFTNPEYLFQIQTKNLLDTNSIIISNEAADRYFSNKKIDKSFFPLNSSIEINQNTYRVSAVVAGNRFGKEFAYDFLAPISKAPKSKSISGFIIELKDNCRSDSIFSEVKTYLQENSIKITANNCRLITIKSQGSFFSNYVYKDFNTRLLTSPEIVDDFKRNFNEVENTLRIASPGTVTVGWGGSLRTENNFLLADASIFDFFPYYFIKGSAETAFAKPNSLVITKAAAYRYFGADEPLGRELIINSNKKYIISGVIKNMPAYSHLLFDFLVPLGNAGDFTAGFDSGEPSVFSYIKLNKRVNINIFNRKLGSFHNQTEEPFLKNYCVTPLPAAFDYSNFNSNKRAEGDAKYIQFFSLLASLIVLIAALNYINLSIAMSASRSKEVGMRKVFGSGRKAIIIQFLFEAALLSFFALLSAYLLIALLLPYLNQIAGKSLRFPFTLDNLLNLKYLSIAFFTGMIAGGYPAYYFSRLEPAGVLYGEARAGANRYMFRKFIILIQFTLSVSFVIVSLLLYSQLEKMRNQKLGYDGSYTVKISLNPDNKPNPEVLAKELKKNSNIISINDFKSIREKFYGQNRLDSINYCYVKIKSVRIPETIGFLGSRAELFKIPGKFRFEFLESEFEQMFLLEERMSGIFYLFSMTAIAISLMGLFSLAAFMVEQRRQELAIRKVYGAGIFSVTFLVTKELFSIVLISNLFAWMLTYPSLSNWLAPFFIRGAIGFESFLYSLLISIFFSIFTAGAIALKTALNDPIKAITNR